MNRHSLENDREIQNILNALRKGIVTNSTKELLEELEEIKESLSVRAAKLSSVKRQFLELDECSDFLFSLTALDYSVAANREMLFKRFIRRVELGNERIRIFYNPLDKPFILNQKDDFFPPSGGGDSGNDDNLNEIKNTGEAGFLSGSPALSVGGAGLIEPEPRRFLYNYSSFYIFVKGVAGIVVEKIKVPKPLSPKHHLDYDENGRFCKRQ